jgi:hypothetical protein
MRSLPVNVPSRLLLISLLATLVPACANWNEDAGVENHWRASEAPQWTVGETSAEDVMSFLGPPSQIVDLQDQVVYYYLRENVTGKGYYFLVYNTSQSTTRYDRAIFFFDVQGRLLRYAYSDESLSYEK